MSSIVNKIKGNVAGSSAPSGQHLAAVLTSKGTPLEITHRPTPTPGPDELLIEVKALAINPIDYYQRALGFAIKSYPAIPGSDIGGIVLAAGSSVPSDAPKPGVRVAAMCNCFYTGGEPDYGAFQTRVVVPAACVVPLPDGMSFNEASLLPMAVTTTWAGWYVLGLPLDKSYKAPAKQGLLVWGGSSSIGSAAVQEAKLMGYTVYVTASEKQHEYVKSLGANKVFDYRNENVAANIVKAAKEDGVSIQLAYDAIGEVQSCLDVLKEFKGEGMLKLATSKPMSEETPKMEGAEVKFMAMPEDYKERNGIFSFVYGVWLKEKLEKGEFVPSPRIQVFDGGLEAVNEALDEWKKGVSGVKIVLEL